MIIAGKTNKGLVEFCKIAYKKGTGYVWGTYGQVCTETLLNAKAQQYPQNNLAGGQMRIIGEKWLGRRVVDCSGLIKYYIMAPEYGKDPIYNSAVDSGLRYESQIEKGLISTMPEIPGLLVYMTGHVGVYIGDGEVIESQGTAYGVKKTKFAGRGWTKWAKCQFIDYIGSEKVYSTLDSGAVYDHDWKDPLGNASKKLAKFSPQAKITFLKDKDYGWSEIEYKGVKGYIMNTHLPKTVAKKLSKFDKVKLKKDVEVLGFVNAKNKIETTLKKGTEVTVICEIMNGKYKGECYCKAGNLKYYIKKGLL